MKKIILTILSATLLLAANVTITEKTTPKETPTEKIAPKSLDARLIAKQEQRSSKIEAKIAQKAKLREAKIAKIHAEVKQTHLALKEKAQKRAEAS